MSGKTSRKRGHDAERSEAKIWKDLGYPECNTSRYESRKRDDQKVDLCNTGMFNVQIKSSQNNPNYHEILNSMPDDGNINLVCHYKTEKSETGRFMPKGKYYTLSAEDFYTLLRIGKLIKKKAPKRK